MNHTPQIKKAILFAARKHKDHLRANSEPTPYITHLFSVALLVAEDGSDDDVVTVALLHDTIEDTDATREEIAGSFNEHVAALVEAVSESKGLPYAERKDAYLANVRAAGIDALKISIADTIDNIEGRLEGIETDGQDFLDRFSQPPEAYTRYHAKVADLARELLPEHPLTKRVTEAVSREGAALKDFKARQ